MRLPNSRVITSTVLLSGAVLLFAGFGVAHAASIPTCDFTTAAQELRDAREVSASGDLRTELDARRRILGNSLDCIAGTAEREREWLSVVDPASDDMKEIRGQILDRFTRAADYARAEKERLAGQGLWGTKDMARAVRAWRESTYLPLEEQAENFRVWQENQLLFRAAGRRLEQITQTLAALGLAQRGDIRDNLLIARRAITEAQGANREAGEAIRHFGDSQSTALLIQESLRALATAYESFFSVSQEVDKVIPL